MTLAVGTHMIASFSQICIDVNILFISVSYALSLSMVHQANWSCVGSRKNVTHWPKFSDPECKQLFSFYKSDNFNVVLW